MRRAVVVYMLVLEKCRFQGKHLKSSLSTGTILPKVEILSVRDRLSLWSNKFSSKVRDYSHLSDLVTFKIRLRITVLNKLDVHPIQSFTSLETKLSIC